MTDSVLTVVGGRMVLSKGNNQKHFNVGRSQSRLTSVKGEIFHVPHSEINV